MKHGSRLRVVRSVAIFLAVFTSLLIISNVSSSPFRFLGWHGNGKSSWSADQAVIISEIAEKPAKEIEASRREFDEPASYWNLTAKDRAFPRIVASVTTFPGRMDTMERLMECLDKQSQRPDAVYLHVPKFVKRLSKYNVEKLESKTQEFLNALEEKYKGLLIVKRGRDYGAATKLLGTLEWEYDPQTLIITVDDDSVYHPDMFRLLALAALKRPNNPIVTGCEVMNTGPLSLVHKTWRLAPTSPSGECAGWLLGYKGVAYRVGYLDLSYWLESRAPDACRIHDDVWLSGELFIRGIRPWIWQPPVGEKVESQHVRHPNLSINSVKNVKSYQIPCIQYYHSFV